MSDPVWLTPQGYEDLRSELNNLLFAYRTMQSHRDPDHNESQEDREWQEMRIRQLQELLLAAEVGGAPPDDGVAEPGMVLTVRYGDSDDTESFLLASREASAGMDMEVYSPESPLGRALLGAAENDTREYPLPGGATMSVTLLKAVPFRQEPQLNDDRPTASQLGDGSAERR